METVADTVQPVEAPVKPGVDSPVCWRCRYDLSHTPADSRCPECGLEVRESMRKWEEVPVLGRPRDVAAASLLVVLSVVVFLGGYAGLMFLLYLLLDLSQDFPDLLVMGGAFVVSVLPCVLLLLAARRMRPKLIGRRGIGLPRVTAWVLLAAVLSTWGLVAAEEYDLIDFSYRLMDRLAIGFGLAVATSAALVVPLIQGPLARRMEAWPAWSWLRKLTRVSRLILLITAGIGLIAVYVYLTATLAFDWEPHDYSRSYNSYTRYTPPVEKTGSIVFRYALGISATIYGLALVAAFVLFGITFIAAKRLIKQLRRRGEPEKAPVSPDESFFTNPPQ